MLLPHRTICQPQHEYHQTKIPKENPAPRHDAHPIFLSRVGNISMDKPFSTYVPIFP